MNRPTLVWSLVLGVPLALLAFWVASNTSWADVTVPLPLKGEAATNPYYGAQRLVEALGGRATRESTFDAPDSGGIVVLSSWNWNLSARRRRQIEQWVENGGRLVVDGTMDGGEEFARWSGIGFVERKRNPGERERGRDAPCFRFGEIGAGGQRPSERLHWLCDVRLERALVARRAMEWALTEKDAGWQAMRVRVGRGSVTVINAEPFRYRRLFDGDHGWLLATATQLRAGDEVMFLSEGEHPSLLTLVWRTGAPVVVLGLGVLGLALWRNGVRSGPMAAEEPPVRRSLAEQIRGTGRFALRHDGGEPLHAATVRALDEAARRRVTGWLGLDARDRVRALAEAADVAPDALDVALHDSRARSPSALRETIERLETVRRALIRQKRTGHGIR